MLKDQDIFDHLSQRFNDAYLNGTRWFNQLEAAARFASPMSDGLNIVYNYDDAGKFSAREIHNSTPQIACDKRASELHSLLLPSGRRIGEVYSNGSFDDDTSQKFSDIIQNSNIHAVAHSLFMDLNIGTAALWIESESKTNPIVFKAITGMTILPEYTDEPELKNVWFKRTIGELELKKYGIVPKSDKNFVTCGFIYNRDSNNNPLYKVKNNPSYPWLYIQVCNDNWKEPMLFESRPFKQLHVINDTVRAGDVRGTGIVLKLLNDITYLNTLSQGMKGNIEMMNTPPILANPELGNLDVRNLAGAILPSTLATDGVPLLQPLNWNIDIAAVNELRIQLENKINLAFNVQTYGAVETTPVRTATETQARQADAQRQSLTDISRMVYDFNNIFNVCFEICKKWGLFDKTAKDFKFKNPTLEVENQLELNNLITYKQMTNELMAPTWSQLMMNNNAVDEYIRDKLLIPRSLVKPVAQQQQAIKEVQQFMQNNPQQAQPTNQPNAINPTQLGQQQKISGMGQ